jgi:hypothetical protein
MSQTAIDYGRRSTETMGITNFRLRPTRCRRLLCRACFVVDKGDWTKEARQRSIREPSILVDADLIR